jgi:hypothetical protein
LLGLEVIGEYVKRGRTRPALPYGPGPYFRMISHSTNFFVQAETDKVDFENDNNTDNASLVKEAFS